jgi:hypothetical protein
VTAEAYGRHKFWGLVVRVGNILGRKNVRTDEPSEHVDTKVLEMLVEAALRTTTAAARAAGCCVFGREEGTSVK